MPFKKTPHNKEDAILELVGNKMIKAYVGFKRLILLNRKRFRHRKSFLHKCAVYDIYLSSELEPHIISKLEKIHLYKSLRNSLSRKKKCTKTSVGLNNFYALSCLTFHCQQGHISNNNNNCNCNCIN